MESSLPNMERMLDDSMFADIDESAENVEYLKAVEEREVCLDIIANPPQQEELEIVEARLLKQNQLSFDHVFNQDMGYYLIKCFLTADYAADKAIFLEDVKQFRQMRYESARLRVAKLMFQRYTYSLSLSKTLKNTPKPVLVQETPSDLT